MIEELRLRDFKSFRQATIPLGPLTLLVGTNASGKSNVRDALRFLHGISRGYNLAEIIGERFGPGGELQWQGIRGGIREAAFHGQDRFEVAARLTGEYAEGPFDLHPEPYEYSIVVETPQGERPPRVLHETLYRASPPHLYYYDSNPIDDPLAQNDPNLLAVRLRRGGNYRHHGAVLHCRATEPALTQLPDHHARHPRSIAVTAEKARGLLSPLRFLDLSPEAMKRPSLPGQDVLGDHGENLSSVLQAICQDERRKAALLEWVRELTPLDVDDLTFVPDHTGRVLLYLVEKGGARTSACSASDGTLRFLAMIAALLGPHPAQFYFFEELENGIHPTRLYLLLQLIQQVVRRPEGAGIQVVATTHSPQLLAFLDPPARRDAVLVYHVAGPDESRAVRIAALPDAERLLETQGAMRLFGSGWFEDAAESLADQQGEQPT